MDGSVDFDCHLQLFLLSQDVHFGRGLSIDRNTCGRTRLVLRFPWLLVGRSSFGHCWRLDWWQSLYQDILGTVMATTYWGAGLHRSITGDDTCFQVEHHSQQWDIRHCDELKKFLVGFRVLRRRDLGWLAFELDKPWGCHWLHCATWLVVLLHAISHCSSRSDWKPWTGMTIH